MASSAAPVEHAALASMLWELFGRGSCHCLVIRGGGHSAADCKLFVSSLRLAPELPVEQAISGFRLGTTTSATSGPPALDGILRLRSPSQARELCANGEGS